MRKSFHNFNNTLQRHLYILNHTERGNEFRRVFTNIIFAPSRTIPVFFMVCHYFHYSSKSNLSSSLITQNDNCNNEKSKKKKNETNSMMNNNNSNMNMMIHHNAIPLAHSATNTDTSTSTTAYSSSSQIYQSHQPHLEHHFHQPALNNINDINNKINNKTYFSTLLKLDDIIEYDNNNNNNNNNNNTNINTKTKINSSEHIHNDNDNHKDLYNFSKYLETMTELLSNRSNSNSNSNMKMINNNTNNNNNNNNNDNHYYMNQISNVITNQEVQDAKDFIKNNLLSEDKFHQMNTNTNTDNNIFIYRDNNPLKDVKDFLLSFRERGAPIYDLELYQKALYQSAIQCDLHLSEKIQKEMLIAFNHNNNNNNNRRIEFFNADCFASRVNTILRHSEKMKFKLIRQYDKSLLSETIKQQQQQQSDNNNSRNSYYNYHEMKHKRKELYKNLEKINKDTLHRLKQLSIKEIPESAGIELMSEMDKLGLLIGNWSNQQPPESSSYHHYSSCRIPGEDYFLDDNNKKKEDLYQILQDPVINAKLEIFDSMVYQKIQQFYNKEQIGGKSFEIIDSLRNTKSDHPDIVKLLAGYEHKYRGFFQDFFTVCVNTGQWERAVEMIGYMKQINYPRWIGYYDKAFVAMQLNSNAYRGALALLRAMKVDGIEPDTSCYDNAIIVCCNCGRMDIAFMLLDEMKDNHIKLSHKTIQGIFNGIMKNEKNTFDVLDAFFDEFNDKFDNQVWHDFICSYMDLIDKEEGETISMTNPTEKLTKALYYLDMMGQMTITEDIKMTNTLEYVLNVFGKDSNGWLAGIKILSISTDLSYEFSMKKMINVIESIADKDGIETADDMLSALKKADIKENKFTTMFALQLCKKKQDFYKLLDIYEDKMTHGFFVPTNDTVIDIQAIYAYFHIGDIKSANNLLSEYQHHSENNLLSGSKSRYNYAWVFGDLLCELVNDGIKVNDLYEILDKIEIDLSFPYISLLKACIKENNLETFTKIVDLMVKRSEEVPHLKPNIEIDIMLIEAYSQREDWNNVSKLLEKQIASEALIEEDWNGQEYLMLLKARDKEGKIEYALQYLEDLSKSGIRPNPEYYAQALEVCRKTGNESYGLMLMRTLISDGYDPHTILKAYETEQQQLQEEKMIFS